jgi:hypothetical protein
LAQNYIKGKAMNVNELIAENTKLKRLIQLYEKNCKIVADTSFKMSEMILNLKGLNEKLQFELDMEKCKNVRNDK